tara:strand:- start:266 stop:511 length:246 start_codon:yes stop_codon:yes gene_type:complete
VLVLALALALALALVLALALALAMHNAMISSFSYGNARYFSKVPFSYLRVHISWGRTNIALAISYSSLNAVTIVTNAVIPA